MGLKEGGTELWLKGLLMSYWTILLGLDTEMRPGPTPKPEGSLSVLCLHMLRDPHPVFNQFNHLDGFQSRLVKQTSGYTFVYFCKEVC